MFLGIEIGGTKTQVYLANQQFKVLEKQLFPVELSKGARGIRKNIEDHLRRLKSKKVVLKGIGVGFGGPIDWQIGKIARSHQIKGWSDFNLKKWLQKLSGTSVTVDNDANVAALGEAFFGAGRGFDSLFYITLGSGVGGGFVVDKQIYHGAKPGESEIGHILLDRKGTTLESRCSGWAIDQKIRRLHQTKPQAILSKLTKHETLGEAKFLKTALRRNDSNAKKILNEFADDLAFGISHVAHLFHPQTIILGGGLSLIGQPLRRAVEKSLKSYVMKAFLPAPKIQLSDLGSDAVPMGAFVLSLKRNYRS
jgi:glucokinase